MSDTSPHPPTSQVVAVPRITELLAFFMGDLDWERLAQAGGEQAYEDYNEHVYEEGGCGCTTCYVREVLTGAFERIDAAARES
jgi:hypothetical protein